MNYKKMSLLNAVGSIVHAGALWLLTVIATKTAGYESAGLFSLAMSVGNVFYSVQTFGVRSYQSSDLNGEYTASQYIFGRYLTIGIGIVLCAGYCLAVGYTGETTASILAYLLFRSGDALSDVCFGEFQRRGRMEVIAKSCLIKSAALLILFPTVMCFTKQLPWAIAAIALSEIAVAWICDRRGYMKMTGDTLVRPSLVEVCAPLRTCFFLMLTGLLPFAVTALPRIQLERYSGIELLGYYGNISAPTVLITVLLPGILAPMVTWYGEQYYAGRRKRLLWGFAICLLLCTFAGGIACGAVYIMGEWVMSLIFTKEIVPYVHYMYPLIFVTTIQMWLSCSSVLLTAVRRTKDMLICSMVASLIAIAVSDVLVKRHAINGVIWVLGIASLGQFLLQLLSFAWWFCGHGQESK